MISAALVSLSLSGCSSFKLEPFKAGVTLPYSGHCYFVNAVTGKTDEYDEPTCIKMKQRGLIILSEDWKIIRKILQMNCQFEACTQLRGRFDGLFMVLDDAAGKIPGL